MELKWHKYLDIYEIPDEYNNAFKECFRELYEIGQNVIIPLNLEELKIDRDGFEGNVSDLDKVIEFLEKNNLADLNVLYWW